MPIFKVEHYLDASLQNVLSCPYDPTSFVVAKRSPDRCIAMHQAQAQTCPSQGSVYRASTIG